jgi:predicted enzyme related to lactoylglutathione lyase
MRAATLVCGSSAQAPIEVPVGNVMRARSFYCELLGLGRNEGGLNFLFREEPSERCQSSAAAAPSMSEPSQRLPSLRIVVANRLEQAVEVAWERGGRVVQAARRIGRGMRRALIVDCEGNLVALYSSGDAGERVRHPLHLVANGFARHGIDDGRTDAERAGLN